MTDEMRENRPPEMEEAAPAPASALETAPTSNDVTDDITISHGDVQSITQTNTAESPSQLGAPAPETPGSDDAWRYVCSLINEFTSEEDYRSGDFGREHTREPDPYAINQAPVAYSRKKDCARREGAAFADRLEYVFDELDDEMQAVVRDGWAGREAARELRSGEGSRTERASGFAGRLFRELTGGEAGSDDFARGFIECGDTLLNCFDARCFSLGVARVCGVDLDRSDPDEDDRLGRALMRSGYGAEDHRAYIPGDANPHSAAEIDADIDLEFAILAIDELSRDDGRGYVSAKEAAAKKLAEDELTACYERLRQVRRDALVAAGERVYGRDADHVTSRPPEDGEPPFAVLGQKLRLDAARQRDAIEAFQAQAEALVRALGDEAVGEARGVGAGIVRRAALKGMIAASGEHRNPLPYDRPVEMKRMLQLVESGLPESSPLRETIKRHGAVLIGGDEALTRVKSRIKADPWSVAPDLDPFLHGDDGVVCWMTDAGGRLSLLLPADTERAIFRKLEETVRMKGVPLKDDGEPDLAAMARFWVKAGEQYTIEWNQAKARKLGKNDPCAKEKDPALAIKWDKYPNPACAARIIRLARDAVGRPAKLVDGIIQYVSEQGLELAQNASNGKFIEGPLRDWALEINPSADERWIAATRINLYTTLERIDTRALAKQGKIDVNAWRICDGKWYFTSAGPHAFKMRRIDPTRVSDWAAQVEDGVHLKPVGEPDEAGWYAVAEPEDKEIILPNESGEMVACRPSDLAKTWFPEDPEAGQDLLDQLIAYRIRPRNMHRMQGFAVLRGDGGDGKSLFREMNLTMALGNRRAAERDAHFSGAGLEDMDDNDLVLSTVGAYVNWPADAAQDPVCSSKGWKFLKPMSCGESVTFKVKYAEALTTSAGSIPCIFPVNGTPRYPSYGASKKRRVFDIEFGHPIPEGKKIRRLMDVAMTDEEFVTWPWWHSVKAYSTFDDGFRPNRLSDKASRSAEAESDTLAQIAAGTVPLLCGHAWPLDLVYQLMRCWAKTHMPNARLANMSPKYKRELERVLEPYGLRVLPKRQFRWKSWYDPEVMRTSVHSVCEPLIRRDQKGCEIARDYKPAELANWVDNVELATQGREKVYGWVVRAEDWDLFEATGSKQFDQREVVWLDARPEDGDEPVDDDGIEADSACDASLYEGVYLPVLAGLAKAGCTALSGGPVAALSLERWLAAGGPCVPVVLSAGALKDGEAAMLDDNPELQLGAPQVLCGSPNGAVVVLLPRSATGLLAPRADDPWLDPLALIVSGRAEIAAGNAPAVAPDPDPDPDDDPTPGPGGGVPEAPSIDPARDAEALLERGLTVEGAAPTSSDAPEDAKTPGETAAQGTCDVSAPVDGAHEAPAPSGEDPAANGPSAPAETPVSAAPAAVEGGDAAEEAPGAPDPGYEAFRRHAEGAVEHSGGYVIYDGGPEGAMVCREVIPEDEWAAYGRPTRLTRTVEVDGERLPLID